VIQQRIENPIASRILAGEFPEGDTIAIDLDRAKHAFKFARLTPGVQDESAS